MALGITATLAGDLTPQAAQVVVTGMTAGQTYEVTGSWAGGSWPVRGGVGVASGTQLVLADVAAPINVPVTYTAVHNGASATSAVVTVEVDGILVMSRVDGSAALAMPSSAWQRNGLPLERPMRYAAFEVEGRPEAVVRWTVPGAPAGELALRTTPILTAALDAFFSTGGPVLLRTNGAALDFPAVLTVLPLRLPSRLSGAIDVSRDWTLGFVVVGDPEPNTVVPVATWEDFDAYYAAATWNAFDAQWASASWNDADAFDWE